LDSSTIVVKGGTSETMTEEEKEASLGGNVPTTYSKGGKHLVRWVNNQRSASRGSLKDERSLDLLILGKWNVLALRTLLEQEILEELRIYVQENSQARYQMGRKRAHHKLSRLDPTVDLLGRTKNAWTLGESTTAYFPGWKETQEGPYLENSDSSGQCSQQRHWDSMRLCAASSTRKARRRGLGWECAGKLSDKRNPPRALGRWIQSVAYVYEE
jgi:hypothetical protein